MILSSYISGFLVLGFIYFFLYRRCNYNSIHKIDERANGIKVLGKLNKLLQSLQQHRGMSGVYLSGDASFKLPLMEKQKEIDASIKGLTESMNSILGPNSFWGDVEETWLGIKSSLETIGVQQSFMQHSRAILRLLDVMEEFGDTVSLTTVDNRLQRDLSDLIVAKLPGLTERLGQARALGASATVEGMVSTVVGMRLTFLSSQITEALDQINKVFNTVNDSNISDMVNRLSQSIHGFLATLDKELIQVKIPSIHSDDYFRLATCTIDEVYMVYDRLSPMLMDILSQQTHLIHHRQRWISVLFGSALAGVSGLVFAQWWP